jgi:hypothetical protein
LIILSVCTILLFLVLNIFTPLIADDYSYSLGIQSVYDILVSQYNQYFTWGGRCVAHFLAQFWLLLGKPIFNVANTIVYVFFILLVQFHITGKIKTNPAVFLLINIFFWFLVPAWGQNFLWLDGSCNYLWTTTIILLFLVPFRKRQDNSDFNLRMSVSFLFFFLGILAGWSNENSGAAVLFLLIAYFAVKIVKGKRIAAFEILGVTGFLIGFLLLIAAPGNYIRLEVIRSMVTVTREPFVKKVLEKFLHISWLYWKNKGFAVMAVSLFFGFDLVYHQKRKLHTFVYFYALAAVAACYSMLASPGFPDRAFLSVVVFSGITLGNILLQVEIPEIIKRNAVIFIFLAVAGISFSVLTASKNIMGIYLKWQNRKEYILAEREKGNLDITVKAPIPARDRHTALYGLTDILDDKDEWPNTSIAEYFGLRSIRGLDTGDPW